MKYPAYKIVIANIFGAAGYLFIGLQWVWGVITFGHDFLSTDLELLLSHNTTPIPEQQAINLGPLSPIALLLAIFITILVLVLSIITLVRLPKSIAKQSSAMNYKVASNLTKQAVKHHVVSQEKQKIWSWRLTWVIKMVAITIPIVLLFLTSIVPELPSSVIITLGLGLAALSFVAFTLQAMTAWALRIPARHLW